MAAVPTLGAPAQTPPPDVPNLPGAPSALSDYLRRFSTWANAQLQGKVPSQSAAPAVLLLSPSLKTYRITVSDDGALIATLIPPGSPVT
jgi:hypothetical protein